MVAFAVTVVTPSLLLVTAPIVLAKLAVVTLAARPDFGAILVGLGVAAAALTWAGCCGYGCGRSDGRDNGDGGPLHGSLLAC